MGGGQESFLQQLGTPFSYGTLLPTQALSPYLRGLSHLPTLPAEPSRIPGSLYDSRVPLSAPALWAPSQLPAAAVASRKPSLDFLTRREGAFGRAQGLLLPVWCKGGSSVPPAGKWEVCVLDCSSDDSGGRGRGEGGDASRRAGEAGGGERK